jgi:hypothetical protein
MTVRLPERFTALLPYLQRELRCDAVTVLKHGLSALDALLDRCDRHQVLAVCPGDSDLLEVPISDFLYPRYLIAKYRCCAPHDFTFPLTQEIGGAIHHFEERLGAKNMTQIVACAIEIVCWFLETAARGYWVLMYDEEVEHFVYFVPAEVEACAT